MPLARKTKAGKATYGREATSAERARFKKFLTAEIERDRQRQDAEVAALKNFVAILKSGKGFPKPNDVEQTTTAQHRQTTKKVQPSTSAAALRSAKVATGTAKR